MKVDFTKVKSMSKETGLKLLGGLGFVQRVVVSNELTSCGRKHSFMNTAKILRVRL